MRKLAIGIVVVVAISMLFAQVLFAQQSQAAGSTVSTSAWTLGVPGTGTAESSFTGNEAIVVESGKVVKMEKMAGVKDGLQMNFKTDHSREHVWTTSRLTS